MGYITEEGQKQIKAFRYRGTNLSLSYNYLWSPIADQLLKITPSNIAPNTLTVFGFLLHTVATIILCLQFPWNQDAPRWSLFLYGSCVFWYQMLDNVDGKQARKLQNSTPLGMIMDHGCDALGVICLTVGMSRVACQDDSVLILWVFISVVFSFYISAWAQYWSNGFMILGKANGVDDGIPIIWASAIFSTFFGQEMFRYQVVIAGHAIMVNRIMAWAIISSTFLQIYSVISNAGDEFTKDVGRALRDLGHVFLLIFTILILTLWADFVEEYAVGILIGLAFTMARSVSDTLVCSTAKMQFKQFSPTVLIYAGTYLSYTLLFRNLCPPSVVVYGVMLYSCISYFQFVISICNQIASVLNIPIFTVYKPAQAKN